MTTLLNFFNHLIELPADTLVLLVGLSAIALAAFTVHVISKLGGGRR